VRQMEKRGIQTEKGNLNRWIRKANEMLRELKGKVINLIDWAKEVKEEISKPQAPTLADYLARYYDKRNAGAYSNKAKTNNLKDYAATVNFLSGLGLSTLDSFEDYLDAKNAEIDALTSAMKGKDERKAELKELLRMAAIYKESKPIYDELNSIKFKKKREAFAASHDNPLRQLYMSQPKLKPYFNEKGQLPVSHWKAELASLEAENRAAYEQQYKPMQEEIMRLLTIQSHINEVRRDEQQREQQTHETER